MRLRPNPRFPTEIIALAREMGVLWRELFTRLESPQENLQLKDGVTAPSTVSGSALIYVDTADGSLKIKFGSGTVKTITTDP